jgi:hypothetical protein
MNRQGLRLLIAVLVAAAAGLGLLVMRATDMPIDVAPVRPQPSAGPASDQPTPDAALNTPASIGDFAETLARPLFNPTRRPLPPPAKKPATEAPPPAAQAHASPNNLRLVGMMVRRGSAKRALIRSADQSIASWVEVGADVDGWRVRDIEPDRVVVERGGDTAELMLYTHKPAESGAE